MTAPGASRQDADAGQPAFRRIDESTRRDWDTIMAKVAATPDEVADHVLAQLRLLAVDHGYFAVDRLAHALQTAHLAELDGKDDEYVVCALVHDIGDSLAPLNHAALAAAVVEPYVSAANHWMVRHHDVFQGYFYWHHLDRDRHARDAFAAHEFYEHAEEFAAKYDVLAFDPDRRTPPLEHYADVVRAVLRPHR